jgi:hypothetical protein
MEVQLPGSSSNAFDLLRLPLGQSPCAAGSYSRGRPAPRGQAASIRMVRGVLPAAKRPSLQTT